MGWGKGTKKASLAIQEQFSRISEKQIVYAFISSILFILLFGTLNNTYIGMSKTGPPHRSLRR